MEQNTQQTLHTALQALGASITEIVEASLRVDDASLRSSKPLVFNAHPEKKNYGQGLQWKGDGPTKQLIYRANDDRLWSSENIDLGAERSYKIDNVSVISKEELGSSVRYSNLTKVGTLQNLRTQGNLVIDDYIYYNSSADALGLGTENPNGKLSIATLDAEFIVDTDPGKIKIGAWTTSDVNIITDNTTRLTVQANGNIIVGSVDHGNTKLTVHGKIGVNVNNIDSGVDLAVAGNLKFQNKLFAVGSEPPANGTYKKGDVVWNDNPQPTGYIGWVCIKEGTPGEWRPFGNIGR